MLHHNEPHDVGGLDQSSSGRVKRDPQVCRIDGAVRMSVVTPTAQELARMGQVSCLNVHMQVIRDHISDVQYRTLLHTRISQECRSTETAHRSKSAARQKRARLS